jgi:Flp pilus assembly protein TadD
VPAEVRRLRAGSRLLERRDPRGALYLLAPLRPEYDGERSLEILTARALFASASLSRAQAVVEPLLERMPDDAYLNLLMGRILQRRGDPGAARYLALAAALDPDLGIE